MYLIACLCVGVVGLSSCATLPPSSGSPSTPGSSGSWQKIDSDYAETRSIRFFGFIDVTQDEEAESQYFEAGFAEFEETAPLSLLLDNFRQPSPDTCDFRQRERNDSTPMEFKDELDMPGFPYEFVGAGHRIDVSAGSRRYAKLTRTSTSPGDAVQYETDVGSLPITIGGFKLGDVLLKTNGLRVSSGGDVFPAFSAIQIPPVDGIRKFKPRKNQKIVADTRFSWSKGRYASDPDVRVQIEGGGSGRAIFCAVVDDGEFRLPDSVKAQLLDANIPNPSAYRDAIWFYLNEDALLIASQSSYY